MIEMTRSKKTIQGGSVKKTLFVMALAAVLVFAVAGSAFAASGQNRQGSAVTTAAPISADALARLNASGAPGTPFSNPIAGAGTYTYMNWNTALGTNAGDNSPHGNYTTTTVKCVVCHAVHYAAPGMAPVGSGQVADTLLRMKASDACVYCHATAGVAVNGVPVYEDGIGNGHQIGTNCDECHTGVHAAGADNSVASLAGYLLKGITVDPDAGGVNVITTNVYEAASAVESRAISQGFAPGAAMGFTPDDLAADPGTDARTHAVGIFCAECHFGSYAQNAAGASTNVNGSDNALLYAGHRVGANITNSTSWNSNGSISSGARNIAQIAWKPATTCNSCHDATYASGFTAFPHGWGGSAMWLTNAASADVSTTDTVAGANGVDANVPQLSDGICLKCHVGDDTHGVGISF
jgi:hypothetical protein